MKKCIILGGPTAVGKSDIAVALALAYYGEVISADSRQIYTGLDVGSGKITYSEMKGVPHHMLDIVSPKEIYTAYQFGQDAYTLFCDIQKRESTPLIVGGSGFYIHALRYKNSIDPYFIDKEKRACLEKMDDEDLISLLEKTHDTIDIDTSNRQKVIRAIERGAPPKKKTHIYRFPHLYLVYIPPLKTIQTHIDIRLEKRWDAIVKEVDMLMHSGVAKERLYQLGLEYRFISQMLLGVYTQEEAYTLLNTAIRQYAKRQIVWFKKYGGVCLENEKDLYRCVDVYMKRV